MAPISPSSALLDWLPFLGAKVGIARSLSRLSVDPDDLDIHHIIPRATSIDRLTKAQSPIDPRAGGVGTTLDEAINPAMGELLERYCLFKFSGTDSIYATYAELKDHHDTVVDIKYLRLFSSAQYSDKCPFAVFGEISPTQWILGTNLLNGSSIYVPAQLVCLTNACPEEEPWYFYSTSTGCAASRSMESTIYKAILEVIERDALMIRWYGRFPPPLLDLNINDLFDRTVLRSDPMLSVKFYDLSIEGTLPVVACALLDNSGRHCYLVLSSAAAATLEEAARKAVLEAGQGRPHIKLLARNATTCTDNFFDLDSNCRFYADPRNRNYVDWFLSGTSHSPSSSVSLSTSGKSTNCLDSILTECVQHNWTPIALDITSDDVREHGIFACKVIIPELMSLCISAFPFLSHPRLTCYRNSKKLGTPRNDVPAWIPHPFP